MEVLRLTGSNKPLAMMNVVGAVPAKPPPILVLQQAQFPVAAGHFHLSSPGHAVKIVKSPG